METCTPAQADSKASDASQISEGANQQPVFSCACTLFLWVPGSPTPAKQVPRLPLPTGFVLPCLQRLLYLTPGSVLSNTLLHGSHCCMDTKRQKPTGFLFLCLQQLLYFVLGSSCPRTSRNQGLCCTVGTIKFKPTGLAASWAP
jgi:hypothetical protein